ncbi:MAG: hypothetical protein ACK46C_03020 [Flavobacteriales bacterium]
MTSLPDLLTLYRNDPRVARIAEGLQPDSARVQIAGTIGSSQALIAASVIDRTQGVHVFVLTDKEEAAYFINDLEALKNAGGNGERGENGEKGKKAKEQDLYFFPAPSRSAYDAEGHHDGERVTRTEVLEVLMKVNAGMNGEKGENGEKVAGGSSTPAPLSPPSPFSPLLIITYPEALVPLVVAKEVMQKNTLSIKRNEELPIDTLE